MTLQSSGTIYMHQVNTELGNSTNSNIDMNSRRPRQLAGSILNANMSPAYGYNYTMSAFYGKSRYRATSKYSISAANRNTGNGQTVPWVQSGSSWTFAPYGAGAWPGGVTSTDSMSLDIEFTMTNVYLDCDNWSGQNLSFYVGGSAAPNTGVDIYRIPFYNINGPGYAWYANGAQKNGPLFSAISDTFSGWSWNLDRCGSNADGYSGTRFMVSYIARIWPTTTGTSGNSVTIDTSQCYCSVSCFI